MRSISDKTLKESVFENRRWEFNRRCLTLLRQEEILILQRPAAKYLLPKGLKPSAGVGRRVIRLKKSRV